MRRVRPSIILLKDSVATENLIPLFQCNGKHFFDINSMIDCSFIQDYQRRYTLGTQTPNQTITFDGNFRLCLMPTFFIGISTISCLTFDHFASYRHHQCQRTSHRKREFSWCLLFENLFELRLQMFFRLIF